MSIRFGEAVDIMQQVASIAENNDDPIQAMLALTAYVASNDRFNDSVSNAHPPTAANWLKAWGRNPASFMYRLSGGYDAFLHHKYLQRRGNKVSDIPNMLRQIEAMTLRDMPTSEWGEHQFAWMDTTLEVE